MTTTSKKKPSERIGELAKKNWQSGIDPGFSQAPDMSDYLNAILQYLDEQALSATIAEETEEGGKSE